MWGLVKNELLKLLRKKRFMIVLGLLLITTLFSTYNAYYKYKESSSIQSKIENTEKLLKDLNDDKKQGSYNRDNENIAKESLSQINNKIQVLSKRIDLLKELKNSNTPWKDKLQKDIEQLKIQIKEEETIKLHKSYDSTDFEDINKEILIKEYYLSNNIAYDYNGNYSAFNMFYIIISGTQRLFLLLILSILLSDIVSKENSDRTIKLLLSKPVSRSKIIFSKFLAGVISSNGVIIVFQVLGFLILGLTFKFGSPLEPIAVGTSYKITDALTFKLTGQYLSPILGSSYVIPVWKAILLWFAIQFLLITALAAFCILISTLFKSSTVSTSICFIYLAFMVVLRINITSRIYQIAFFKPDNLNRFLPYIFNTYWDSTEILDGSLSFQLLNLKINFIFFAEVAACWIAICYILAHFIFIRRDVLE